MRGIRTLRAGSKCLQGRHLHGGHCKHVGDLPSGWRHASTLPIDTRICASRQSQQSTKWNSSAAFAASRTLQSQEVPEVKTETVRRPTLGSRHSTTDDEALSTREILETLDVEMDRKLLLDLLPAIALSVPGIPVGEVTEISSALLREMGKHNLLAPVFEILQTFISRVNQAVSDNAVETRTAEGLEGLYIPVIESLKCFHRQSTLPHQSANTTKLHRHTDLLFVRIIESLIGNIDKIPRTSTTPSAHLSEDILSILFSRPVLQPELMRFLLGYARERNIKVSSIVWWRCFLLAVDQGDYRDARRYKKLATYRAKHESKAGPIKDIDHESGRSDMDDTGNGSQEEFEGANVNDSGANVHEIMRARTARRFQDVIDLIGSRLYDPEKQSSHAWSHLLNISRKDPTIDNITLGRLRDSIPPELITGHTLTPLMLGFLEKGDAAQAWQVWRDVVDRQSNDPEFKVDRVALAVACVAAQSLSDIDASIRLVDAWAKRPSSDDRTLSPHSTGKGKEKGQNQNQSIILDAQNINVLLKLCLQERRPSIALRIFKAALPRWGVYTDDISLTLLLDTCRLYNPDKRSPTNTSGRRLGNLRNKEEEQDIPNIRDRLRQLTDGIRFSSKSNYRASSSGGFDSTGVTGGQNGPISGNLYEEYDAIGFAKSSINTLLDPSGYTWRKEHTEPAWSIGRDLFREVIFTNWPELVNIPSVLDFDNGPFAHQARNLVSSFFRFGTSTSNHDHSTSPFSADTSSRIGLQSRSLRSLRSSTPTPYLHLVPSANTFHSAISLLGYHNLPHEIPLVLAWMKQLDIRPKKRTMIWAFTYLGEVEGPRRVLTNWEDGQSRLVRDPEVLRRWLIDWLGRGVPSEDEVAAHRRRLSENNVRLSA